MDSKKIPELDASGLRKFALTSCLMLCVLFGLLIPWLFGFGFPTWPWVFGGLLAIVGFTTPMSLNPVYKIWMRFGLIMNRITTPIILGIVFFIVLTPIAFMMRLFGRDTLNLKSGVDTNSYRIESSTPDKKKLEKPY